MASMEHEPRDHDRGLACDVSTLLERRRALKLIAGVGLATITGCGKDDDAAVATTTTGGSAAATTTTAASSAATTSTPDGDAAAACSPIPEETAGPYPGDGTNGPNVLTESGIVRSDITSSFGSLSGVADGIPLTVDLTILDAANGCAAYDGAAVYLWHCDREGGYSLYSQGVTDQNYLRGVQEADSNGRVTFQSIFPAAYSGRWPHIHFEVYASLDEATSASNKIATSQLALPEDACAAVYATDGYEHSIPNLAQTSLERDMVFSDGSSQRLATVTGSVDTGYTAESIVTV